MRGACGEQGQLLSNIEHRPSPAVHRASTVPSSASELPSASVLGRISRYACAGRARCSAL
ncbi:hypothetical protein OH77DRAFT_1428464 [Trametes cingulata]|nr:hypothetical protein OH77DRAFT_1428464 [Trametes cingulata]